MTLPTVLLTGFEPFEGADINPSWEVAHTLDGEIIAGHRVVGVRLPVVFGDALDGLRDAIARCEPAMVVCLGVASRRTAISIERLAINLDDARIPDNAGRQPIDVPIVPDGPAAYFSTLPIKAMLGAVEAVGIPGEISQTAGTYVCNHVFYGLMHALAARPRIRAGFIHVPPLIGNEFPGGMTLDRIVAGLRVALAAALVRYEDKALPAGDSC